MKLFDANNLIKLFCEIIRLNYSMESFDGIVS